MHAKEFATLADARLKRLSSPTFAGGNHSCNFRVSESFSHPQHNSPVLRHRWLDLLNASSTLLRSFLHICTCHTGRNVRIEARATCVVACFCPSLLGSRSPRKI
eukprot:3694838-Pleurochrysis_carterae.AAC.2